MGGGGGICALVLVLKIFDVIDQWFHLNKLYKLANGKLSSNFKFIFKLLAENRKIFKRIMRHEYIDQISIHYISLDMSRPALQTNRKLFSNF